jgi:hypothetical protein
MNTLRKITALLMASVVVMMVAVPMAFGDDAQTSADVTLDANPVVDSVVVSPDPVDMNQGYFPNKGRTFGPVSFI